MEDPRLAAVDEAHRKELATVMDQLMAQSAPAAPTPVSAQVYIYVIGDNGVERLLVWRVDAKERLRAGDGFSTAEAAAQSMSVPKADVARERKAKPAAKPPEIKLEEPVVTAPPVAEPLPVAEESAPPSLEDLHAASDEIAEQLGDNGPPLSEMDRGQLRAEFQLRFGRKAPGNIGDDTLRERLA